MEQKADHAKKKGSVLKQNEKQSSVYKTALYTADEIYMHLGQPVYLIHSI